jgi:hypothetical protein
MLMRRVSAKDKIPNGLLRGAAVAGLVSGLAAASLGGVPTASATCVGIFGININLGDGGGCTSSLFGFALGLGPGTIARAQGFFVGAISVGLGNTPTDLTAADATGAFTLAYAGGANATTLTRGNLALAAGQGPNTFTQAGGTPVDVGNVALNLGANNFVVAGDIAQNPNNRSYFNLAVNLGHDNNVQHGALATTCGIS